MAPDLIRDSLVGQIIYRASGRKILQYPEERPGFVLPEKYGGSSSHSDQEAAWEDKDDKDGKKRQYSVTEKAVEASGSHESTNNLPQESTVGREYLHHEEHHPHPHDPEKGELATTEENTQVDHEQDGTIIVDWYGSDDPECPLNVSVMSVTIVYAAVA